MKATKLLYIFLLIIAVISNCNAQNDEAHSYISDGNNTIEQYSIKGYKYNLDFYKCKQRQVNNKSVYIIGEGPLTNVLLVSDTTIYAKITTKTSIEKNESALETAQCDIADKLLLNLLAAMYPEIIQAVDSAITHSKHVFELYQETTDGITNTNFEIVVSRKEFQNYFEGALKESEFFKKNMGNANKITKEDKLYWSGGSKEFEEAMEKALKEYKEKKQKQDTINNH
ncbi:MAG: hypothetical protein J6W12_05265 [Bacteroidales bacterium]|nr:hypothetical protein [Bacteroidales bacterium]